MSLQSIKEGVSFYLACAVMSALFFLLLLTPKEVQSQEGIPTNLRLIVRVARQAAAEALRKMPRDDLWDKGGLILLSAKAEHDANWIVEEAILEELIRQGFRVITGTSQQGETKTELSYRILEVRTNYLGQSRRKLLGGKWIHRLVRVKLSLQAVDLSKGGVFWLEEAESRWVDSFPTDELSMVQDDRYPFAKAELEEKSLGRFFEPVIVSGIVGWLIYLFFSSR